MITTKRDAIIAWVIFSVLLFVYLLWATRDDPRGLFFWLMMPIAAIGVGGVVTFMYAFFFNSDPMVPKLPPESDNGDNPDQSEQQKPNNH